MTHNKGYKAEINYLREDLTLCWNALDNVMARKYNKSCIRTVAVFGTESRSSNLVLWEP